MAVSCSGEILSVFVVKVLFLFSLLTHIAFGASKYRNESSVNENTRRKGYCATQSTIIKIPICHGHLEKNFRGRAAFVKYGKTDNSFIQLESIVIRIIWKLFMLGQNVQFET